jgi:DNA-binding protein H-NS
MNSNELAKMSAEELWTLHTEMAGVLSRKIAAEKSRLEARLREVRVFSDARVRRPYPKVLPKYHNPKNREQTWSGRGKQPRWLAAQLGAGKRLDQFLIRRSA